MRKLPRKPAVENKYHLTPGSVEHMVIADRRLLTERPFWRNDQNGAYCISGGTGKGLYGSEDFFWIGIYDEDAAEHPNEILLSCTSYEGMCSYGFAKFFDPAEIDNMADFELQEQVLKHLNWLLDEGIVSFEKELER